MKPQKTKNCIYNITRETGRPLNSRNTENKSDTKMEKYLRIEQQNTSGTGPIEYNRIRKKSYEDKRRDAKH